MPYLDHAATSPILPEAKEALLDALEPTLGNASALHRAGHDAKNKVEQARAEVARLIGAEPEEIIFTSGSSESNNTVVNAFAGGRIAVSAIEHESVLKSAEARAGKFREIAVNGYGRIYAPSFEEIIENFRHADAPAVGIKISRQKSLQVPKKLISVMLASNELGAIEPIAKLAKEAHQAGIYFHTDATAALGKIPFDVKKLGVDFVTLSAHKIGGIIGVGALYRRRATLRNLPEQFKFPAPLAPLIIGGMQEQGLRSGTYPTALIASFGAACRVVRERDYPGQFVARIRPLRDRLAERILAEVPYSSLNTNLKNSLPHILNCSFQAAEGESIQLYLDLKNNIAVSTGSACAAGDGKPSHVIMATHHDAEVAHSSIRFSLGLETTERDIDTTVSALRDVVSYLQSISTIKIKEET